MSYFDDVYLKRINRYGNTLQDRIQGKREHDFIVMMNKSPNKVEVREVNPWKNDTNYYDGVLQTKEYDEDEIQNYLLVPCDQKVPMGHLLYFTDVRRDVEREKPFMAYAEDPYTTAGYNRYTVVELEETLNWIVDGVPYSSPVHATGGGSGARDKNINLKFRIQFTEAGVYLPNKRYSLIMPYNEAIKKNHRVTLGGETWRITGFDKISVSGVMYLTLEEALTDENDDAPVANYDEYENWAFSFHTGKILEDDNSAHMDDVCIYAYYKEEKIKPDNPIRFEISCNDPLVSGANIDNYQSGSPLSIHNTAAFSSVTDIPIYIKVKGAPDNTKKELIFRIKPELQANRIGISGPDIIHMGDKVEFVATSSIVHDLSIDNEDCCEIVSQEVKDYKLHITILGKKIGKATLSGVSYGVSISKEIEVISLWLGGKDNVDT